MFHKNFKHMINKRFLIFLMITFFTASLLAQDRSLKPDMEITSEHSVTIKGNMIPYIATVGTIPVWDNEGKAIAYVQFTYYRRKNVPKPEERPLIYSFNGGPGSGSVWMHLAYTGPRILKIDDEGYPVQPYGYKENPYSILDVSDIVYIEPINTGYSRTIPLDGKEVDKSKFFGINADIKYLAEWMNTFTTRYNRWPSPKYIIGESYGGTRVMGLSLELQNNQWMYLNGIIMVSPADYKAMKSNEPVGDALNYPYFAAAAWHHKVLPAEYQSKKLEDYLAEVETYTVNEVIPALTQGGFIDAKRKNDVAEKLAKYTGLSTADYLENNLSITTQYFWKTLLKDRGGYNIGRLDSRYLGIDRKLSGIAPDYSAELTSWLHSFTPAINHFYKNELGLKTDVKYNMFGPVSPWNNENDNTRENMRQAMAQNPYLKVLIQSGYYDGATTYFAAKFTMWQADPSGKMKDRFYFKGYKSGHMMYLRKEDLEKANEDIREFIKNSASNGKSAKY
jgi:carboxypeptidase C (cathepsin A)